jgi:hypothetical protein
MSAYEAWVVEKRPIYHRLPECYKDNPIADWLTQYWDALLIEVKEKIDDLPKQLDPQTCDEEWLDFLAPLCGFYGDYWDRQWTLPAKRTLINNSYTLIWKNKGSRDVLSFVLDTLGIEHKIWVGQSFVLGVSQVSIDRLGNAAWEYKILLPDKYASDGKEFKLARKINKLFGCLWCRSEVVYERDIVSQYLENAIATDPQTFLQVDEEGTLLSIK